MLHTYPTHPAAHPPSHPPPPPSPSAPDIVLVSEDDDRPCVGGLQEAADDFVELSRLGLPWDLDGLGHAYTACSTDSPAVRPPPPPHGDSPVPQPCDAQIWDSPAHLHPSELPGPVSPPVAPCADPAVPAEADAPQTHPEPPHGGSHIWKMSRNGCTKPGEQHGEHSTPWGHTPEPSPLPFLCSLQCILPSHPQQLTPAFHPPFQSTPHHTPSPVGMNSPSRGSGFSNCHCSHTEASPQAPVLAFCKGLCSCNGQIQDLGRVINGPQPWQSPLALGQQHSHAEGFIPFPAAPLHAQRPPGSSCWAGENLPSQSPSQP